MEENCAAAGGMETGETIGAEMTGEAEAACEPAEEMSPKERTAEDADRLRRDETEEVLRLRNEREQTARERARLVAEEQIRQIGQLDGEIRSVDDLMAMPDYDGFYALVKKGISMVEAYKLTRYDELIKELQKRLSVTADGVFGPQTKKAAVLAHQKYLNRALAAGIGEDGVWGPETYYATERVQKGDETEDVFLWQGLLYCLGFDPVGLDGEFGANTEAATKKLQTAKGLNPTGIADRYTWAKALGYTRPKHTILRMGSAGAEVKYLQRLLTEQGHPTETTGQFGESTKTALMSFQKEHSLEADGEAGPLTWAAIEYADRRG